MVLLLVLTAGVILGSALCSLSEAALMSVPDIKVERMASGGSLAGRYLKKLKGEMERALSTLVVITNFFNIVGVLILGRVAATVLDSVWLGVMDAALTILVIIYAEIVPKNIGERFSEAVCRYVALPLYLMMVILRWPVAVLWWVASFFVPARKVEATTDEEEIRQLTKVAAHEGVIDAHETRMIERVFELDDITAQEIMTPRVRLCRLSADLPLEELREQILEAEHSRIILTGKTEDDIVGMAPRLNLLSALLRGEGKRTARELAVKIRFVPGQAPAHKLLEMFRRDRVHIAIVTNETGDVLGVVTLEDVLEILTGEIIDEKDTAEDLRVVARYESMVSRVRERQRSAMEER